MGGVAENADLSEQDGSEEDAEAGSERDEDAVQFHWAEEDNAERQQAVEADEQVVLHVNEQIDEEEVAAAQLPVGGADIPNEIEPLAGDGVAELREIAANVRRLVEVAQRNPAADAARASWGSIACGLLGTTAAILSTIYAIKTYYEHPSSARLTAARAPGGPAAAQPPDWLAKVAPVIHALETPTDAQFWTAMAGYVRRSAPRPWDEQVIINEMSADIFRFRMREAWRWPAARDKLDLINHLVAGLEADGLAATYEFLPDLTWAGAAVPRAIAAKLVSTAICQRRLKARAAA